jgi:hypothetical protein
MSNTRLHKDKGKWNKNKSDDNITSTLKNYFDRYNSDYAYNTVLRNKKRYKKDYNDFE